MKEGPDIARLGSLLGDPARANMLNALMEGRALTSSELAAVAGVGAPTASAHLAKLEDGGLVSQLKQGRHRYYAIADVHVGAMLEQMMGLAASLGHHRSRSGPKEPALREARICYNHLAGEKGVALFESLKRRSFIRFEDEWPVLTAEGKTFVSDFGIDIPALEQLRRPMCRTCLDWSERRNHLAGSLGQALLERMLKLNWAVRKSGSRVIAFTPNGQKQLKDFMGFTARK